MARYRSSMSLEHLSVTYGKRASLNISITASTLFNANRSAATNIASSRKHHSSIFVYDKRRSNGYLVRALASPDAILFAPQYIAMHLRCALATWLRNAFCQH